MSDLLSISSTAVMAYQRALGTVSNNIANVGTEGYSRQDVSLTANTPSKQGNVYIGNGVRFAGIQRQVDDFVQSNLRNSQSDLTTQEPMLSYANRVVDIMGGESTGLTSALNQFFDAARDEWVLEYSSLVFADGQIRLSLPKDSKKLVVLLPGTLTTANERLKISSR